MTTDAEFFKARGFGMKIGFGARPALLVIDMVKAFTNPDLMLGANLDRQIEAHHPLLAAMHAKRLPVIFSTVIYEDAESGPPDAAFCDEWTAMGGVEGVEVVYNPSGIVPPFGIGADASSLPITVIADDHGVIRAIVSGTSDGLGELKTAIDMALGS